MALIVVVVVVVCLFVFFHFSVKRIDLIHKRQPV